MGSTQATSGLCARNCAIASFDWESEPPIPKLTGMDYEVAIRVIAWTLGDPRDDEGWLEREFSAIGGRVEPYRVIIRTMFCDACGCEKWQGVFMTRKEQLEAIFGHTKVHGTYMVRAIIASGIFDPKECPQYVISACAKPLSKFLRTTWCPECREIWRMMKPIERIQMLTYRPRHSLNALLSPKWSFMSQEKRQMICIDKETAQMFFDVARETRDIVHTVDMLDIVPGGWLDTGDCIVDFQVYGLPLSDLPHALERYNQRTKEQVRKALCASLLVATVRDEVAMVAEVARNQWLMRYIARLMIGNDGNSEAF